MPSLWLFCSPLFSVTRLLLEQSHQVCRDNCASACFSAASWSATKVKAKKQKVRSTTTYASAGFCSLKHGYRRKETWLDKSKSKRIGDSSVMGISLRLVLGGDTPLNVASNVAQKCRYRILGSRVGTVCMVCIVWEIIRWTTPMTHDVAVIIGMLSFSLCTY